MVSGPWTCVGWSAQLRMPEVQGEEMHLIAPLRVGRGYRLGMALRHRSPHPEELCRLADLTKSAAEAWRPGSCPEMDISERFPHVQPLNFSLRA